MLSASHTFTRSQSLQYENKSGCQTLLHKKQYLAQAYDIRKQAGHGPCTSPLRFVPPGTLLPHPTPIPLSHNPQPHPAPSSALVFYFPRIQLFAFLFVCRRWAYGRDVEACECFRPFSLLPPSLHSRVLRHSQPAQSQISRRETAPRGNQPSSLSCTNKHRKDSFR